MAGSKAKYTTESFITEALKVHGEGCFDYSEFQYIASTVKQKIRCIKHDNWFEQEPSKHLRANICKECRREERRVNFIREAQKVHGEFYDYSGIDLFNARSYVEIICPDHGPFLQEARHHLKGAKCIYCPGSKNVREEVFLDSLPEGAKPIPVTKQKITLVSEEDFDELNQYKWCISNERVARRISHGEKKGKFIYMHRQIMGVDDPKVLVDHISMDTLDNRRCNLRIVTRKENAMNTKTLKGSLSRFKGAYRAKGERRWFSNLKCDGKLIHLGCFETEEEAAMAHDIAVREHRGPYGRYNFPLPGEQSALWEPQENL